MSILLAIFYFFYFCVVGVYLIFMPKVLLSFDYSPFEIGVIFAAGPLIRLALPFLFMLGLQLTQRLFNMALVVMVVSATSFFLSVEHFYPLLFSNIFLGFGLSLIMPFVEVVALEHLGKERYGKIRLFGSVGFVLVALVLVKVLSRPEIALYFLLTLTYITALISFIIARYTYKQGEQRESALENDVHLLQDWRLWGGLILMQMSFGSFYNFFTIYVTDNGITLDMAIYLWSFGVLFEIVMLFFQGRFLRENLLTLLQITTFATALRWLIVYLYPQNLELLFFSQAIHALSFALFHSAAIAYLFHHYTNKNLAQQFFSGISYGFGGLIGALLAGYIYEWYPEYLFLSSAFIAFGASVLVSLYKKGLKSLG